MDYYLDIHIDDDFDASNDIRGISSINHPNAIVDESIFKDKLFYKPVYQILKYDLSDINKKTLTDISKKLSIDFKIEISHNNCYIDFLFDKNNPYDLDKIVFDNSNINIKKILINYSHCPVNSFYLIQKGKNLVNVIVSPFTKNYFTISDSEWCQFINYLDKNYDIQKVREYKLNSILGDKSNQFELNLIRKLKFIEDNEPEYRNRFLSSVFDYYLKYGKLSQKQFDKAFELI